MAIIALLLRVGVGGLLLVAAIAKTSRPSSLISSLRLTGFGMRAARLIAVGLPAIESTLGVALVVAPSRIVLALVIAMLLTFTTWLVWVTRGGLATKCACFGGRGSTVGWHSVARNLGLIAAVACAWPLPRAVLVSPVALVATFCIALALSATSFARHLRTAATSGWDRFAARFGQPLVPLPRPHEDEEPPIETREATSLERLVRDDDDVKAFARRLAHHTLEREWRFVVVPARHLPRHAEVHIAVGDASLRAWVDRDSVVIVSTAATLRLSDGSIEVMLDGAVAEPSDPSPPDSYWRCVERCLTADAVLVRAVAGVCGHCKPGPFCSMCWASLLGDQAWGCGDACDVRVTLRL